MRITHFSVSDKVKKLYGINKFSVVEKINGKKDMKRVATSLDIPINYIRDEDVGNGFFIVFNTDDKPRMKITPNNMYYDMIPAITNMFDAMYNYYYKQLDNPSIPDYVQSYEFLLLELLTIIIDLWCYSDYKKFNNDKFEIDDIHLDGITTNDDVLITIPFKYKRRRK